MPQRPDLPPVSGLQLEQLLQSDYFGLNTVLDPEVEALQSRYMELMARTRRTADERLELRRLPEQIDAKMRAVDPSTTFTGRDRREQLMLEAIDRGLVRMAAARSSGERDNLSRKTIELASKLFVEATADPELWRTRR